jgi:hypothetical protein
MKLGALDAVQAYSESVVTQKVLRIIESTHSDHAGSQSWHPS